MERGLRGTWNKQTLGCVGHKEKNPNCVCVLIAAISLTVTLFAVYRSAVGLVGFFIFSYLFFCFVFLNKLVNRRSYAKP